MTQDELKAKRFYLHGKAKQGRRMLGMFYGKHDVETLVADCITDLMHLCTVEGWDYWRLQEQGLLHHNAEQLGGEHG